MHLQKNESHGIVWGSLKTHVLFLFGLKTESKNSLISVTKLENFLAIEKSFQRIAVKYWNKYFWKYFRFVKVLAKSLVLALPFLLVTVKSIPFSRKIPIVRKARRCWTSKTDITEYFGSQILVLLSYDDSLWTLECLCMTQIHILMMLLFQQTNVQMISQHMLSTSHVPVCTEWVQSSCVVFFVLCFSLPQ